MDVAAGASECFTAVASTGEEVFGNFEVLTEGSYTPVEVTVRSWVRACGLWAAMNGMVGWLDRIDPTDNPDPTQTKGDGPRRQAHLAGGGQVGGDLLLRGGCGAYFCLFCTLVCMCARTCFLSSFTVGPSVGRPGLKKPSD